jgi:uncharacterized protein YcbK (DUF882 family)
MFLSALALGATVALPGVAEASRLDNLKSIITPELRLFNANTGERMSAVFWRDGQYVQQELRRIDWLMRDWREAEMLSVDRDLLWGLAAMREAAMRDGHDGEIRFLSGYRSRKTNDMLRRNGGGAARNSFHIRAKAIDFSLPGVPVKPVSEYAQWLEMGGVGYYPGSFIHIDTGSMYNDKGQRRIWTG